MPSKFDIEHILILMMENRSFDHYLGALTLEGRADGEGIRDPSALQNPSIEGPLIGLTRLDGPSGRVDVDDKPFRDPPHEYEEVAMQIRDGAMDGFVEAYELTHKGSIRRNAFAIRISATCARSSVRSEGTAARRT